MADKRRRAPAPAFKNPQPFNPKTGSYDPLMPVPHITRVALMQVTEIHDDYLVCHIVT